MKILFQGDSITDAGRDHRNYHNMGKGYPKYASELLSAANSVGRIAAAPTVGCPPAIPIVLCGERITPDAIQALNYYGIDNLWIVK